MKTLYDVLKLEEKHQFYFVYAGDKYLSSSFDQGSFVQELKGDKILVNPSLPEWDDECEQMSHELFEILDTNQDNLLDSQDLKKYLANAARLAILTENKAKDFNEIAFDMKLRKAGYLDFTLPKEEVEAMIVGLTQRDLETWQNGQKSNIKVHRAELKKLDHMK